MTIEGENWQKSQSVGKMPCGIFYDSSPKLVSFHSTGIDKIIYQSSSELDSIDKSPSLKIIGFVFKIRNRNYFFYGGKLVRPLEKMPFAFCFVSSRPAKVNLLLIYSESIYSIICLLQMDGIVHRIA